MSELGVVLIKAPPCTGKTSQLQLLKLWLRAHHPDFEVVHISFLTLTARDDVVKFIKRRANYSWEDITAGAEKSDSVCSDGLHHSGSVVTHTGAAAVSL